MSLGTKTRNWALAATFGTLAMVATEQAQACVVIVSSEVGWGSLPANALARRFGDLLGDANQRLAARAAEVYGCMAGLPLRLKPDGGARWQLPGGG